MNRKGLHCFNLHAMETFCRNQLPEEKNSAVTHEEEVESRKSKEEATIIHIESPPSYDKSRNLQFPSNVKKYLFNNC